MEIRRIIESDKPEYLAMAHAFYKTDAVMHDIPDEHFESTFSELMRSDTFARCYIFEEHRKIIGYALTARTFSQEAGGLTIFIEEVYIKEDHRGKGYGTQFFEYLFHDEPSAKRFRLEVEDTNPRAIALYKRLGFTFLEYLQMYKGI